MKQFPSLFGERIPCPTFNQPLRAGQWNTGRHASAQPRMLHDLDTIVMLIGITYRCSSSHKLLSYDPRILTLISERAVSFSLSHQTGFTRQFLKLVQGLTEQGSDLSRVIALI